VNYRHRFHAGNVADVFKHWVLVQVLDTLRAKDTPFCVIDTHAGSGLYRLKSPGEFEHGIGRLWPARAEWPALASYFERIRPTTPGGCAPIPGRR
jgi:23S rRNA (adenine2030-N6)-methyltransferase